MAFMGFKASIAIQLRLIRVRGIFRYRVRVHADSLFRVRVRSAAILAGGQAGVSPASFAPLPRTRQDAGLPYRLEAYVMSSAVAT
jgi:hypothetical protein